MSVLFNHTYRKFKRVNAGVIAAFLDEHFEDRKMSCWTEFDWIISRFGDEFREFVLRDKTLTVGEKRGVIREWDDAFYS